MTEDISFIECVEHKFGFLEKEYGYRIYKRLYGSELWADGTIEFISPTTLIQIGKDRGSFWVLIKPSEEPDMAMQSLQTIVESLGLMKKDDFSPGPVASAQYEKVLDFYARVLRQHCMPFIQGDFSQWTKVLRHHLNWLKSFGKKMPAESYSELENYIKLKEKTTENFRKTGNL